jgi:DNA-binding NtrC family response regulator
VSIPSSDGGEQLSDGISLATSPILHIPVGTTVADAQRLLILATLKHCANHKTMAAAMLGISLKTLYNRLNAYRLRKP